MATTLSVTPPADDRKLLAPVWHTVVLVLFVVSYSLIQIRFSAHTENLQLKTRVPLYLFGIFFELILLAYVWFLGLRGSGTKFADVIGGKWTRAADVWRDIGAAFVFWLVVIVFLASVGHALGQNLHAKKALLVIMPRGALEMILWVALSISAGFCEEFVFRGYLQKQFFAMTGINGVAIAGQALVFGGAHGYQGVKGMITITIYGALFGVLAMMRKSLRPGMIQHAMQDSLAGIALSLIAKYRPDQLALFF
ncbi:MAG: type II CAAX endopeptidase family protein [Candidatus Acidiferrales bacterium]|jgi:CAAX protease family protein